MDISITRRAFITTATAGLTAAALSASAQNFPIGPVNRFKAITFDAFAIFDPRPVFVLAETLFPEKGIELGSLWKTKQFEYSWLRAAAGRYKNFWEITEDALIYAAKKTGVELSVKHKDLLKELYFNLDVWPDVVPVLQALKKKEIRLSFLSNWTLEMLKSCSRHGQLDGYFEKMISTDYAQTFKPDPTAYQLGIDILKLKKEEILFVAFAGWDSSGSKWFGYPTFWMNRQAALLEELDVIPDGTGKSMTDLIDFVSN